MHNFLSREGTAPDELLRIARSQLRPYDVELCSGVVKAAVKRQGRFELRLAGGRRVRTKKLLLATGIRDNCPDIPGFRRFVGRGVYYCSYCDGYTVRDRPLAALGRGVDGAELALALTTWSRDVLFCTNGIARPSSKVCAQLERYGVGVRGDRIVRVEGRTHLEWLVFRRGQRVRCAGLFIQHGCAPQSDLAAQLGCAFTRRGAVTTRKGSRTTSLGSTGRRNAAMLN